ncbi:TRAP transporter 4TM/12TM fusion protein [Cerasibacillus quisquiliarum]|uniref:C4-dicarboxylate ABC transporter n=1 Tax=Cerasibacillus quisquiliarum TaxID=227865 RepID=A0A511UVY6_9BACI|nr:TRAP transporter permease [Cerasibacillus quisquiliarum]MBB5146068.1 TRAP transporter 4TM/12TM fusion protein [Cerasibacillus quisquiliarum]GEN30800.1 C4-dicarboxylate ABC transporter [Cerasibacillus quisquiliarum]
MTDSENNQKLSEKEQEELLEKYDAESRTRQLSGITAGIIFAILLGFSLFQLYTGAFGQLTAYLQRTIHLGFALVLIFLLYPARKSAPKRKVTWYDYVLALLAIIVTGYWPVYYETLVQQFGGITEAQMIIGGLAILLVLEATRRAVGLPIMIIAIAFLLYAYFGPYMPAAIAHGGLNLEQLIHAMYFTTEGILGTPLQVSSTYIFLFLLFGAFLVQTGVGNYFNDLAISIAGRRTGGPAKVAIFSSALQGTISGSSVANTVTTGSYTIPLMKRLGYKKNFAGAVEAASSTGGQIMPPIMGAAAFLMIEFAGVGYWEIAKAALIPALLYFSGIWIMTHLEAKKLGLLGLPEEEIPPKKDVLKKIHLLIPILAIIWFLYRGFSIERTALYGILATIIVSLFLKETRITPKKFILALTSGARTALGVAAATASAGIIVGVVTKTGLGLKLGNSLVGLAESVTQSPQALLLLTLFFTMIASLILGMGSPTTANYIITSTIALPAILALNDQFEFAIPILAAHMFVFYFGIVADITPPVALAAFAATGISGGEPIRTGLNASKLAIAAYIIPYMFVLQPQLLMIDTTFLEVLWIIITAIIGMIAIGSGLIGYWYRKLHWIERIISALVGLMLIYPETVTDFIGIGAFVVMLILQFVIKKDQHENQNEKQSLQA